MAPTQREAELIFDRFVKPDEAQRPKTTAKLVKDRAKRLALYTFSSEHLSI